jgi:hypothetical protein
MKLIKHQYIVTQKEQHVNLKAPLIASTKKKKPQSFDKNINLT